VNIKGTNMAIMTPAEKYKYISKQSAKATQLENSIATLKVDNNTSLTKAELLLTSAGQLLRNKNCMSPDEPVTNLMERNLYSSEIRYSSVSGLRKGRPSIKELEQQNRKLEGKVNELNDLLKDYWERIKGIQTSVQNKDLLIEKYKAENKSLKLECEELYKAKESLRMNSYSKSVTEEIIEDSKASRREMELKQSSIMQELAKEKSENKILNMEIIKFKNKEKLSNETIREQETEIKRIVNELEVNENDYKKLNNSYINTKKDYESLLTEHKKLKDNNDEVNSKLSKYKNKVGEQLNEINSLKAQVGIYQQEIVIYLIM
jgi:chromosome segregation ATPase